MGCADVRWLGVALFFVAWPAHALQLELPRNARQTAARDSALDQASIPIGPFAENTLETRQFEGVVKRRAYKINSPGVTPLQILAPLRQQIEDAGFDLVLDCNQITCGGYDFRFAVEVLPAPNMYVNIREFHFLTAVDEQRGEAITLLASSAEGAGYLQIIRASSPEKASSLSSDSDVVPRAPNTETPAHEVAAQLLKNGFVVLHDIDFAVGTTALDDQPSAELAAIAALLVERPSLRVAVVGHTDTVGGLEANIAVSRARAKSVRERLVKEFGADPARVAAQGMGYLAPKASNLTIQGREENRRVEVIVITESD